MTNLISVVTATLNPVQEYLTAAYQSLNNQALPVGWDWQWIVQEDGKDGDVRGMLPEDPKISIGVGGRAGESVTRNLCLARADGELIKTLDADDILAPGSLIRDISIFLTFPEIGWVTSKALDLFPDGTTWAPEYCLAAGRLKRGSLHEYWRSNNYELPVHPATLCMRRDLLLCCGGWMALPASSDTGLLIAADSICDGYYISEPGLFYRKWPGQVTNQAAHNDPAGRMARMRIIEARAIALARLHQSLGLVVT